MSQYAKLIAILLGLAAVCTGACEPSELPSSASPTPHGKIDISPAVTTKSYSLPSALRGDDDSMNVFVEQAMDAVVSGDYEPFRLMWSVRNDAMSRVDYEQRWAGLTDVRVRELRRIILVDAGETPTGIESYALLVDFSHDPATGSRRREPLRDVVWLVVKEQDQWRLAKPPKKVKLWLREQADDAP